MLVLGRCSLALLSSGKMQNLKSFPVGQTTGWWKLCGKSFPFSPRPQPRSRVIFWQEASIRTWSPDGVTPWWSVNLFSFVHSAALVLTLT